jgi:hypothetical protein
MCVGLKASIDGVQIKCIYSPGFEPRKYPVVALNELYCDLIVREQGYICWLMTIVICADWWRFSSVLTDDDCHLCWLMLGFWSCVPLRYNEGRGAVCWIPSPPHTRTPAHHSPLNLSAKSNQFHKRQITLQASSLAELHAVLRSCVQLTGRADGNWDSPRQCYNAHNFGYPLSQTYGETSLYLSRIYRLPRFIDQLL